MVQRTATMHYKSDKGTQEEDREDLSSAIPQLAAPPNAQVAKKIVLLVLDADYTFDPIDKTVADAVREYLCLIERPDFDIICHVRSPWN